MFFSDKCFYVLIDDTREQKTDFSYWLNTVEQLGGENSSLIVVLNKKHGHTSNFDEIGYRGHFGKLIKDVIEIVYVVKPIWTLADKILGGFFTISKVLVSQS